MIRIMMMAMMVVMRSFFKAKNTQVKPGENEKVSYKENCVTVNIKML